jgi:hypothetical protein
LTTELEMLEFGGGTDFVGQLAAAAGIERDAAALGATGLVMNARLVQADLRYCGRDLDAVAAVVRIHQWAIARQALELATAIGDVWLQAAVLTNMSCNESDAGEPQRAVEAAEKMMAVAATGGVTLNLLTLSHLSTRPSHQPPTHRQADPPR